MSEESVYDMYLDLQKIDIEKYKKELSQNIGREVSEEETIYLWIKSGRAKGFHDYFMREHLGDKEELERLIEEESAHKAGR